MTIEQNKVVSLTYKLSNHQTGEKIEETSVENPLLFLYGVGQMIPDFEANLHGKKVGDSVSFAIPAANAYGTKSEDHIAMVPIDVFQDEQGKVNEKMVYVGAMIPMSDNQGNHMHGKVLEITPEYVKMDFNHQLAGVDLHFAVEILEVRDATSDEIAHGHAHGPDGHHHH